MSIIEKYKNIIKTSIPILLMLFIILLLVFSVNTFSWLIKALKPITYAFILAYLMDSVVRFLTAKLKIERFQGIFLACMALIGIVVLLFYIFVPKLVENINAVALFLLDGNIDINEIIANLKDNIDNQYLQYAADSILRTSETIKEQINLILIKSSNVLMHLITNIGSSTLTIITSFIINIYMLAEKNDLVARGKRLIFAYFDEAKANRIIYIFKKANVIFKSFLNGKILDSLIVGIICTIMFSIFKVPYAPLMGSIVGAFNLIPYFGPIIGSVPVILVSFFIDPPKALAALIIILVVQQLDANILDPRIVGNNVGVSPFWILTAVTVGGNLAGIPGMIFGVPVVVLIKSIVEESIEIRLIEKGIGDLEKQNLKIQKQKK